MWQQSVGGIDGEAHNLFRRFGGHLLDVHPSGRAHHENGTLALPVHDQSQVALARDVCRGHYQNLMYGETLDLHAQNFRGVVERLARIPGQLDPARLAPAPRMYLRLDDHLAA